MYDFGFSRRFVLVRVWYLSSSEAYTNNWGLFGKDNYLPFDWWKHFLKILRRSEDTINLTRRLKKIGSRWVRPLVVLYSIFYYYFLRTHLAPVHEPSISSPPFWLHIIINNQYNMWCLYYVGGSRMSWIDQRYDKH